MSQNQKHESAVGAEVVKKTDEIVEIKKVVTKSGGSTEELSTDKLRKRITNLVDGLAVEYMGIDACLAKVTAYAHSGKFH